MLAAGYKPDLEFLKIDFQSGGILLANEVIGNSKNALVEEELPPELRNRRAVGCIIAARQEQFKLPPFNMPVQHAFIGANRKVLSHVGGSVLEKAAAGGDQSAGDIHPLIGAFLIGILLPVQRQ